MLSRPTTEQILNDCRRELTEVIGPAVTDPAAAVSVAMVDEVLKNCAVRAANEIAWMHEETTAMVAHARSVAARSPASAALTEALAAYDAGASERLHLDDVATRYSLAGRCLAEAIGACQVDGHVELLADGRALLDARMAHEEEIKGDWGFVGRG